MPPTWVVGIRSDETLKELDLVESRFGIVSIRLDDLESDVTFDPGGRRIGTSQIY